MNSVFARLILTGSTAAILFTASCDREDVHSYRAPKEAPAPPAPSAPRSEVTWTLPPGWQSVENTQPMRVATLRTAPENSVEVSITAFPGVAGGLLDNINRWRGQLGLPPAQESELPSIITTTRENGVDVSTLSIAGAQGQQMLGAIIRPGDGQTWFVKATTDPKSAEAITTDFLALARSFRLDASAQTAPASNPSMPFDAGSVPGADEVGSRLASWTPPANWKPEPDTSGILAAAFSASNNDGGARATVTSLMNNGGGTLANINRWRDQLGLAPVESLEKQPTTDLGSGALMVDLTDAAGSRRMAAAIINSGGQSWFFKLTGSKQGVESEFAAFEKMVRSVGLGEK